VRLSKRFRALAWRGFNPVAVEHERSKSKPSARIRLILCISCFGGIFLKKTETN
jgi:hypothetical protein